MRKQNGITLVSMVIAIVVMLILAGSTITLSINGTLFGKIKEATEKAKEQSGEEAKEQSGEEEEIENALKQGRCSHEWTAWEIDATEKNGEARFKRNRECSKCGKKQSYMLGAYINYDPSIGENGETIETTYISEGAKTGGTEEQDRTTDGSKGNGYGNQEFAVTSIKLWKVIGKTEDDKLIIMSDDPVMTVDNKKFFLYNEAGYLNAIKELDKISSIYGQGKYADKTLYPVGNGTKRASGARSIRIEDMEYEVVENTYEKKLGTDGKEYVLHYGNTNSEKYNSNKRIRYFDDKTQEWKEIKLGDEPITFRDVTFIGFNKTIVINGKTVRANDIILKNSSGASVNCWFATKRSKVYYYWTFGSCIFGNDRGNPVAISPLDRVYQGSPVQPIVFLKNNIDYDYNEDTNTYTINGYK